MDAALTLNPAITTRVSHSTETFKPLLSDGIKTKINYTFNGASAGFNLLTFLNGNFHIFDSIQENMESLSAITSKIATGSQGLINSVIEFEKKSLIAFIGAFLELPIAIFTEGKNLFLARGLSAGLNHFDSIISRTKQTENGVPILDENGNPLYYDHFREEGWIEGVKTTFRHLPILSKELIEKPFERKSSGLFPRSFFLCSSFMILGSCVAFLGFEKLGATIRHFFGGTAGIALATDQSKLTNEVIKSENPDNLKKPSLISNYAMSGILWVLAAIPDLFKHYDFFSSKVNNSSEIALCLDRLAGIFFIRGNQREGENK